MISMYVEKVAFKMLSFVPYFKANDAETAKCGFIHVNKIGMALTIVIFVSKFVFSFTTFVLVFNMFLNIFLYGIQGDPFKLARVIISGTNRHIKKCLLSIIPHIKGHVPWRYLDLKTVRRFCKT